MFEIIISIIYNFMKLLLTFLNIIIAVALIVGLFFGGRYLYNWAHYTRITAVFNEAEPLENNMNVFFKGFRIGKVTGVEPNEDYTATYLHIVLFPADIRLPENISVKVKDYKNEYTYVDIILPKDASPKFITSGTKVEGSVSKNASNFLNSYLEDGSMDAVIDGVVVMLDNVNNTVKSANALLFDVKKTFDAASPSIITSTRNVSAISDSISDTSLKIDNALSAKSLDGTVDNFEKSSEYIEKLTQNLSCATRDLPETMDRINSITKDVSDITSGVSRTLQKPFGGARLIMGSPVSSNTQCSKK